MHTPLRKSLQLLPALWLIPTILLLSCGRTGSGSGTSEDSAAAADSLAALEDASLEAWPDTAYSSAADVNFTVEHLDSASGELSTLRNLYAHAPGIFTFRGGERRDADYGGKVDSMPSDFHIDWEFTTEQDKGSERYGAWGGGTGWTGQPLYVEWPDSIIERFKASGLAAAKEEVMIGSLCGDIYFLDYATGKPVRPAISGGNPIKGTMSLDPTLNGNLYVGQGIPSTHEISAITISLFQNKIIHSFGPDPKAPRQWHAYDSSAIRVGQFLFRPGENGTLYKWLVDGSEPKLHSAVRYRVGGVGPGMEASMAVSRNYGYTADNAGNIICFNLNTLRPVWHYKLPDDTDSSPVICEEDGGIYLYTGCEVEHPGVTHARYVKLDALTGKEVWAIETPARRADVGKKHFDGGYYGTTLPGRGNCKDLLFVNVVENESGQNGKFVAIERATGKTRYSVPLGRYAWSSPVGFLTPKGEQVVVTFDCAGKGYIFNGSDGRLLGSRQIGANFESSPAVKGNTLIIGSRGSKIYRMSLR